MSREIKYIPKFYTTIGYDNSTWWNNPTPPVLIGFMTPFGNDKPFEKRKETADYWVSKKTCYIRDDEGKICHDPVTKEILMEPSIPNRIINNVPRFGFRITDFQRRMTTSNVLWRVAEPEGFEVEISSQNLDMIIQELGISKGGIIQGECLWGREHNTNVLVPEDTTNYGILKSAYEQCLNLKIFA